MNWDKIYNLLLVACIQGMTDFVMQVIFNYSLAQFLVTWFISYTITVTYFYLKDV